MITASKIDVYKCICLICINNTVSAFYVLPLEPTKCPDSMFFVVYCTK